MADAEQVHPSSSATEPAAAPAATEPAAPAAPAFSVASVAPDAPTAKAAPATKIDKKRKREEAAEAAKAPRVKAPCLAVFGLGNASDSSRCQRHSLGARVVDKVASDLGADQTAEASGVWQLESSDRPKMLILPQGDINDSGSALKETLAALDCASAGFLIVLDDCSLPLGTIRLRQKGSAGGHNGLKSVETIYGADYHRLKLGIGGVRSKEHVVGEFTADEAGLATSAVDRAVDAVKLWLSEGPEDAGKLMSKVNNPDFCHVRAATAAVEVSAASNPIDASMPGVTLSEAGKSVSSPDQGWNHSRLQAGAETPPPSGSSGCAIL